MKSMVKSALIESKKLLDFYIDNVEDLDDMIADAHTGQF